MLFYTTDKLHFAWAIGSSEGLSGYQQMTLRPVISGIAPVSNEFAHFIATCFSRGVIYGQHLQRERYNFWRKTYWKDDLVTNCILRGIRHSEISLSETKH